jgi:hypothetical protein
MTACGSSSPKTVPKAEIIRKGDAICRNAVKQVTAAPPTIDPTRATAAQIKGIAPFFRQVAASTQTSVSQIAALGKPDKDAALLERILAGGRTAVADNLAVANAAQKGDRTALRAAFAKSQGDSGRKLAKQFGFKVCAQGGG